MPLTAHLFVTQQNVGPASGPARKSDRWLRPIFRTHLAGTVPARAALLFFHGLRSSADSLDDAARTMARHGFDVYLPDAPHHGARRDAVLDEMPDTGTRAGYATLLRIIREARDEIPALVDHALGLGYEKVAIGGVSLGAYIALAAPRVEPRVAAIVSLLGSPDWTPHEGEAGADVDAFREALAESPHLDLHTLRLPPMLLCNGSRDVNVRPEPARALAERLRGTERFVHREWDVPHFVPPETWSEMLEATGRFVAQWTR